jgi:2-octaprenyl-6-methoxyphenol hydroxylase
MTVLVLRAMNAWSAITDTDIAIIGGGPVGAALALALRGSALRVTVLEARAEQTTDPRPIALSHGSRLLLERLNAWAGLHATPINQIHVSQRGGFGRVAMNAADCHVPSLGYVLDYKQLFSTLSRAASSGATDYREGARVLALSALAGDGDVRRIDYTRDGEAASLSARLVVVADGGEIEGLAPRKTVAYAQHALTARVSTSLPHHNVAYERFTAEGPLALLPFDNDMSLVWMLPPARAETLLDTDPAGFCAALRVAFGSRLGEFTRVAQRACYPLALRYTTASVPGVITIGNAAQTLHPVAGQGFNLGLRDAWELAQLLHGLPNSEPQALTNHEGLRHFTATRRVDRGATIAATHSLVQLFSNDFLPLHAARGAGMALLGSIAPLRNFIARRMIFGARG